MAKKNNNNKKKFHQSKLQKVGEEWKMKLIKYIKKKKKKK